mmetsp:Transcript_30203/g.97121  ORF Transcript_30203/g.97121 Transcript_30203/m.97121 type:complete len:244 (+) Transcript_30203:355-1086(+)
MAGTVGAGERRTPAGPLHSSAESAPPTISAKVSGGRTTASSAQRKAVRRRPGGAPPPQSTSLKFCAVAGGWPTVFVSVPSPSAESATSSPGCSHLPISRPQQFGTVPIPMSSPGCRPSSSAMYRTSASRLHARTMPVLDCSPPAPRHASPFTLTSTRRPRPSKSEPRSPGAQSSSEETTSSPIAVAAALHLTKPKPTETSSSACTSLAEKSLMSTNPPSAAATSAAVASRETGRVISTATSSS